jgi:hypothetical protein
MIWKGYDVLEIDPDRIGPIADSMDRKLVILDTATGQQTTEAPTLAPAPVRPFTWTAIGRSEIAELLAFREARFGRLAPFWFPSWQSDLSLADSAAQGAPSLTLRLVRYGELVFPVSSARRHIAIYATGQPVSYHEITATSNPGDGLTEMIQISPAAVSILPLASTRISFLRFCRLEQDEMEVQFLSLRTARAEIRLRELPNEVPE